MLFRKRVVHDGSASASTRAQEPKAATLEELFSSSPLLTEHLPSFASAGIDAALALELSEVHLSEILGGANLGVRIRVHQALAQLARPPPIPVGHEDEKVVQMLTHGSWSKQSVQHVIAICEIGIVLSALYLTIAAAALIAAPSSCRDWDDATCSSLLDADYIVWSVAFAGLFVAVNDCMAVTVFVPALSPDECDGWLLRHWSLVLGVFITSMVYGSVAMLAGIALRVVISARQPIAIASIVCIVAGFIAYMAHAQVMLAKVLDCPFSLSPNSALQRMGRAMPRTPEWAKPKAA